MASMHDDYRPGSFDPGSVTDLLNDDPEGDEGQEGENVTTEDTAVWCEKCGIHNIGDCFIHGGKMTVTPDNAMPSRACMSLPKVLTLKHVRDSDPCSLEAKRGVFSKKFIKLRTMFGPMEAKRMLTKPKLQTGMMEYQLQTSDNSCEYLDISDENSCNWMMFVRPANVFAQQNMTAFQDKGNIFFVTCKNIPKGTELRVWYAAAYAKAIGKRILLPERVDRKQTSTAVKKGKKSLQEQAHNNMSASATSHKEPVKNLSEKCLTNSKEIDEEIKAEFSNEKSTSVLPVVQEKTTRSVRAAKDNSVLFACNMCNTLFTKLGQLDSHICKELGEVEEDGLGCGTRRRKGKPRKLLDSDDGSPTGKVAKAECHGIEVCSDVISANIPHEDIISHLNRGYVSSGESAKLYSDADLGITLLPSTALIPTTTTEFSGDDGENQPSSKNKRGPGRPKGSKNKHRAFTKTEQPVKTDTSIGKRHIYTCQHCDKSFTSQEQHIVHEASHTNTLPYVCAHPGCDKSFNSKFKHQRHIAVHEKPNNFPCKFCSSTFNRVDHLKNHLLVHDSNRNTFTCTICGKSYLYKTNLTFHMAKHEAEEGESLRCLVCSTKFESKDQLKLHVNTHNRYKKEVERLHKHNCPQCHKRFTTAKDIRRHMVTHSKERHFLCEHCPQTFVRKDHLRRHYTSNHKKEFYESQLKDSPFGCSACLLVFKKKDFLDYHMKSAHPEEVTSMEASRRRDKAGKCSVKLAAVSDSSQGNPQQNIVRVNKDSQNQLVRLLQKQPIQKPETPPQQLVQFTSKAQQSVFASQHQSEPFPLNVVKVEQANNPNIAPRPCAIVYPASLQSAASQTPMYDSEEMIGETFTVPASKTIPFRFQNQLVSQQQLQVQSTSQLQQLQPNSQQQDTQQQLQQDQQSLLNQIQMHQQHQAQVQQQQFQQQQLHQQIQPQSVTPMVPGMQVDILNSLTSLNQTQDMPGQPSVVNIITLGGHNFILRQGQVLDLNSPVQLTVIKDPQINSKQAVQQHLQPHMQHLGVKSEASGLIYSQGQILQGNVSKPDHCYASATLSNPTLSHILSSQVKTHLPVLDKSNALQGPSITDEEATRIMAQIKNAGGVSLGSSLPENTQGQNELLVRQHQQQLLQHQHQQQLHQDHFQQQENQQREQLQQDHFQQQENQQQQQPLQNLSSFALAWSDSLSDYASVTELPVSGDVTSINQGEGMGTVVRGSTPASWILQLSTTMLDQPQIQQMSGQHLTNSHVMSVTTPGPANDS